MALRRILVVDDLEDTATSLAYLLEQMGHSVEFTTDPQRVVGIARRMLPEIIFIDIGMSKLDGWQLTRMLRVVPGLETTRIFAVTGYATAADRARSYEAGCEEHFVKPMGMEDLKRVLGPGIAKSG
jgi:CheY-like chemotaxis protein